LTAALAFRTVLFFSGMCCTSQEGNLVEVCIIAAKR
jgi:hypothetical protein